MAQIIAVNVYEIQGVPVKTVSSKGFPAAGIMLETYTGSNTSLYGIINFSGTKYSTIETLTALKTLANA